MRFKTKMIIFLCGAGLGMFIGGMIAHFQYQSWLANHCSPTLPCAICIGCAEYRMLYYVAIGMAVGGILSCIVIFLIPPSEEEKEQKILEKRLLEKLKE